MARQSGNGIAYFPLDVNIFNTFKVKALRKKCGAIAELALIKIYAAIYGEQGYYMVFDEDAFDIMQDELGLETPGELKEILESMVQKELLNYAFLKENNAFPFIITSHGIQLQFQKSIKNNRKQQEVDPNIWILPECETIKNIVSNHRSNYDFISFNNDASEERMFKAEVESRASSARTKPVGDSSSSDGNEGEHDESNGELDNNEGELNESEGDLSSTKFNSVKRKEKEKESKVNKSKANNIDQGIPKDLDVDISDEEPADSGAGRKKRKSNKRYTDKDKPSNNYGEPVSCISEKKAYGKFENVFLKDKELEKLKREHPKILTQLIETLSSYKASVEKGYKSDYAAINNWVIKRVEQEQHQSSQKKWRSENEMSPDREEALSRYEEGIFNQFKENIQNIRV